MVVSGLFVFSANLAVAEEGQVLSPVIVTANPPPAYQTYPELSPGQVTVIDSDHFTAGQFSVADVLEAAPSVQVQSSGELGSYQSISVRGAPGRQLLVYLDGVLLTSSGGEVVDLSQLALNQVESIEIYRSVAPAQFAQDAMGGVINIITHQPGELQRRTSISTRGGSFGLVETNLSHQQPSSLGSLDLRFGALVSKNDFPYVYNNGTPAFADDDVEVRRSNADYQRYNASADMQSQQGQHELTAGFGWRHTNKSLPRWDNSDDVETYYKDNHWTVSLGWSKSALPGQRLDTSFRVLAQQGRGHLFDPTSSVGLSANNSYDSEQSASLSQLFVATGDSHLVTLAGETTWMQFQLEDSPNSIDYRYDRYGQAIALSDEIALLQDRVGIALSGRALLATDEDTLVGGHISSELELSDRWSIEVLAKQAFRMPSLYERYGDQGYFRGNPQLESEMNRSVEASLSQSQDSFLWSVVVFYRISENNIAPVYDSQGVGHYVNIGEVHHQGLEWQSQLNVGQLQFHHQGSFQPSRIYSDTLAYDSNQVPGYYPLMLSTSIDLKVSPWFFGVDWQYQEGLYYDRANTTQAPNRSEINFNFYRVWLGGKAQHRIDFSVNNLLDNQSQDITNKPLPGRSFSAGYSLRF